MNTLAQFAVALVALLHLGFLALEMVFWNKPLGQRVFGLTPEFAEQSRALAANQGLYNGFLAAGLLWALIPFGAPDSGKSIATFFLFCVVVAGIFGGITVSQRILRIQALPGIIALALLWVWPG